MSKQRKPKAEFYWSTTGADYRWRLVAPNGKIIASGEGFSSMTKCRASFRAVSKYAPTALKVSA